MRSFKLEWDRNYGIDERSGWSIVIDGAVLSDIEKYLVVALMKGFIS